jgi:hypothetical protein
MDPRIAQASRPHLPRLVRIGPNRSMLWLGLVAGLAALAILTLRGPSGSAAGGLGVAAAKWGALALFGLIAIRCAFRLVAGLPIIEASEFGIAIWFHGPYHRPFFAPWNRVQDIVLTEVARSRRTTGAGRCNALGIALIEDDQFRIPDFPGDACAPVRDAPRASLAWSSRTIGGDPRKWVELLEQMKSVYTAAERAPT